MAFRTLSEDQAALLTEKQRQQYEKELDIYEERKAFVERMHALEGVEISPYEPKLRNIAVIAEAPERVVSRQKYAAEICAPAAKPEVPLCTLKPGKPVKAVLPEGDRGRNINICSIAIDRKEAEAVSPRLPEMTGVMGDIPNVSFAGLPRAEALLPEVTISIAEVKAFCNLKELKDPQIELPTAAKPHVYVEVRKVEPPPAVLPEVAKMKPVKGNFAEPEIQKAQLPAVSRAEAVFAGFETVELPEAALPAPVKAESLKIRFEEPKLRKPIFPRVPAPGQVKAEFKKAGIKISGRKLPELPEAPKPEIAVRGAAPIEPSPVNLPKTGRVSTASIRFKAPERPKTQIVPGPVKAAPIAPASVKLIPKAACRAEELPERVIVHIPNPYEVLKGLIPEEAGI